MTVTSEPARMQKDLLSFLLGPPGTGYGVCYSRRLMVVDITLYYYWNSRPPASRTGNATRDLDSVTTLFSPFDEQLEIDSFGAVNPRPIKNATRPTSYPVRDHYAAMISPDCTRFYIHPTYLTVYILLAARASSGTAVYKRAFKML